MTEKAAAAASEGLNVRLTRARAVGGPGGGS